ncbi:MAG: DinB family protein [Anaerolineales bacterium]|nr:DinB family protein [Anaerolineales bacterium]
MKELLEYRARLIERLLAAAKNFRAECLAVQDPSALLEKGGWNAHQIAAHTRDVDQLVYGQRARRTIMEDNPQFQNFDGDAYAAQHYDPDEPLDEMLNGFVTSVESLVETLRKLPLKAWARESRHATMGSGFTVQTWVEKSLAHIEEHSAAVKGKAG